MSKATKNTSIDAAAEEIFRKWSQYLPANEAREQADNFMRHIVPPEFKQTTEAKYWEMLGMLPPAAQAGYGFLVGEAMNHTREGVPTFTAFVETIGGFFESLQPMTVAEFIALKL